ncbi:ankyrin repeat domain-containing protein [bacterium]|nr:MAG: ankyrin repeat domain-containing protein [bacterium]
MLSAALASLTLWGGPPVAGVAATPAELAKAKVYLRRSSAQRYTDTTLTQWAYVFIYNDSDEPLINPKFKGVLTSGSLSRTGVLQKVELNSIITGSFTGIIAPRVWSSAIVTWDFPIDVFNSGRNMTLKLVSATKANPKGPLTDPHVLRAFVQKSTPAVLASTFRKTPSLQKVKDAVGMGPMAFAILSGDVRKVKALESVGLSLKFTSPKGVGALHLACETNAEMTTYVKGKGFASTKDVNNYTPLSYALFAHRVGILSAFKPTKAELAEPYGPYDQTVLHDAVALGKTDAIALLLKLGSNPETLDKRGQPPVIYGFELDAGHYKQAIQALKPNLKVKLTPQKYTLLQWAVMSNRRESAKCLLSLGLSPYEKNGDGKNSFDLLGSVKHPVDRRLMEDELKTFKKP